MTLISQLQNELASLSKAETRIAKVVLEPPDIATDYTTAQLARLANVSDPMISRFCKSLGCSSFPDFKVQLAKSLASKTSFISEAVRPGDSTQSMIEKRVNSNQLALEYVRDGIDSELIDQAISILKNAKRIEIFGMGGAAAIAKDAHHKLFRLGIPTSAHEDNLMQRMSAANADSDTVILIFSFTGRTQAMVDAASIGRQNGARQIAITNPDSPLAREVDLVIPSGNELEDTTIYIPMTVRIVILTIIDILATGLALALGPDIDSRLKQVKHSLDNTKTR
jgi:RpiR family carbohydrate utilization transcriptional regulator